MNGLFSNKMILRNSSPLRLTFTRTELTIQPVFSLRFIRAARFLYQYISRSSPKPDFPAAYIHLQHIYFVSFPVFLFSLKNSEYFLIVVWRVPNWNWKKYGSNSMPFNKSHRSLKNAIRLITDSSSIHIKHTSG